MVYLDYRDARPIYTQIADDFRGQITAGILQSGDRLPSVRELASQLTINPNTIQRAYRELEVQGWVESEAGRGSFVCGVPQTGEQEALLKEFDKLTAKLMAAGVDVRQEMVTRNYTEQGVAITLDRYYAAARKLFVSFMLSAGITTDTGASYMLWDLYGQSAIRPLLARMADLLWAEYKGQVYEGQDVGNLMLDFRMLKPAEKNTFFILGINQVYYAALERYFCSANESLSQFVPALLRAEIAYAVHQNVEEEATMTSFKEAFEKAKAYYEALENKDQVDVNIRQMYVLYEQAYKDLSK